MTCLMDMDALAYPATGIRFPAFLMASSTHAFEWGVNKFRIACLISEKWKQYAVACSETGTAMILFITSVLLAGLFIKIVNTHLTISMQALER